MDCNNYLLLHSFRRCVKAPLNLTLIHLGCLLFLTKKALKVPLFLLLLLYYQLKCDYPFEIHHVTYSYLKCCSQFIIHRNKNANPVLVSFYMTALSHVGDVYHQTVLITNLY